MKNPLPRLLVCFMIAVGSAAAQDGAPKSDPPGENPAGAQLLRVQTELVEMPHEAMTKLMREPRQGTDDTSLRKQIDELIAKGEASVYETMTCIARSNHKAESESIEEIIYPTEYKAVEFPGPGQGQKEDVKRRSFRPLATAFETRNTGATMEIEPVLSENGKLVDLQVGVEIVWRTGEDVYSETKDNFGDSSAKMPRFYAARLSTSTTLETGKPQMVGVLSPKGPEGAPDPKRKLLVFVRCEVLTVGR